ncbi:unnamed protein product [Lathyrus sativus]|nr:unnamed protein product [Lathyrus sativus]
MESFGTQPVGSDTSSAGTQLVFDRSGELYVLRENNEKFNMSGKNGEEDVSIKVSTTDFYLRATLNLEGVFSLFKHPKNSTSSEGWTTVWSKPDNICLYTVSSGSGVCGYNSFCTLGDDKRPTCQCPKNYSLVDPDDPHGGCKPDFIQGCAEDALSTKRNDLYYFENLTETYWPLSDAAFLRPFTEELCMKACMEDCLRSVAIFRLGDSCWKKKLPLSNGRVDTTLDGAKAFLKVRKYNISFALSPTPINRNKNNKETLVLIVSVLFGSSAILNVVLIVTICASASIFQYKKLRRVIKSDTCVETNLRKTNTGIRGRKGYVAFEWFKDMPITVKVDVYSYGVVLLEIISCKKCVQEMEQEDEEKAILTDWAYDCYKDGVVDALVEGDSEALDDREKLEKLVMIALWCVQEDPYLRPRSRNVVHMLEGTVEVQIPPYPSQISIQYSIN